MIEDDVIVTSIVGCARCWGEGHKNLTFRKLEHPVDDPTGEYTHWAPCPTNGEPILLRSTPLPD